MTGGPQPGGDYDIAKVTPFYLEVPQKHDGSHFCCETSPRVELRMPFQDLVGISLGSQWTCQYPRKHCGITLSSVLYRERTGAIFAQRSHGHCLLLRIIFGIVFSHRSHHHLFLLWVVLAFSLPIFPGIIVGLSLSRDLTVTASSLVFFRFCMPQECGCSYSIQVSRSAPGMLWRIKDDE